MRVAAIIALLAVAISAATMVASMVTQPCPERPQDPTCITIRAPDATPSAAPGSSADPTPPWEGAPEGTIDPAITPVPDRTPVPGVAYSFDDEFDGTSLDPRWGRYWGSLGVSELSRDQTSVADGLLTIAADRTPTGWRSDLLDTFGSFRQTYGFFEARVRIPKGKGLWPAFWLAQDWKVSASEFDVMEICANPPGTNRGNDVTVLHEIIHAPDASDPGLRSLHTSDLSLAWHTYGLEWRPDHVAFFFDDREVWRFTDASRIPRVPMAVIVSLELGSWCGQPDATTPDHSIMQVDWVRVRP